MAEFISFGLTRQGTFAVSRSSPKTVPVNVQRCLNILNQERSGLHVSGPEVITCAKLVDDYQKSTGKTFIKEDTRFVPSNFSKTRAPLVIRRSSAAGSGSPTADKPTINADYPGLSPSNGGGGAEAEQEPTSHVPWDAEEEAAAEAETQAEEEAKAEVPPLVEEGKETTIAQESFWKKLLTPKNLAIGGVGILALWYIFR